MNTYITQLLKIQQQHYPITKNVWFHQLTRKGGAYFLYILAYK